MRSKKQIYDFISEILNDVEFDGCAYMKLSNHRNIYLVFAWRNLSDNKDYLSGKIAYNCDDLQCDYDWDWQPAADTVDMEVLDCKQYSAEELTAKFVELYQHVGE